MKNKTNLLRRTLAATALGWIAAQGWGYTFILNDQTGLPIKWPEGTVSIAINLGELPLPDGTSYNYNAGQAIKAWNDHLGSVQLQALFIPGKTASSTDGTNEVVFAADVFGKDFDDTTISVTVSRSTGNRWIESDILFRSDVVWENYGGIPHIGAYDLRRYAVHELGHLLGLDSPDEHGQQVFSIMNRNFREAVNPTDDDLSGLYRLYGSAVPPSNDGFLNAQAITSLPYVAQGANTMATKEPGEPDHAGNKGGHSLWWSWTPTTGGYGTITTSGSYFDTTLAVYTGSTLSNLQLVAANDDITPGVFQASNVEFRIIAGVTYHIALDGLNSGDGHGADSGGYRIAVDVEAPQDSPPVILTQPKPLTVTVGDTATFSVTAAGSEPFTYQWYYALTVLPGATSATYSIASVTTQQAGAYFVTVKNNTGGVAVSDKATLTVVSAPPAPPPPTTPGPSSGGGGGAPSSWFIAALSALGFARLIRRKNET